MNPLGKSKFRPKYCCLINTDVSKSLTNKLLGEIPVGGVKGGVTKGVTDHPRVPFVAAKESLGMGGCTKSPVGGRERGFAKMGGVTGSGG